jgi:hypothetical protein
MCWGIKIDPGPKGEQRDFRDGSFSTELGCRRHVRFTPGRDRWGGHPGSAASCHEGTS